MGTRSYITLKEADGSLLGAYCHWDGYWGGVGKELYTFWNTEKKIRKLLKKNGMSSIEGEKVEYHEDAADADKYANLKELSDTDLGWCEYLYIFDVTKGEWTGCNIKSTKLDENQFYPLEFFAKHEWKDMGNDELKEMWTIWLRKEKLACI
jgi:hypothetical protein